MSSIIQDLQGIWLYTRHVSMYILCLSIRSDYLSIIWLSLEHVSFGVDLLVWFWIFADVSAALLSKALRWRHNGHDSVSNHQPHDCLLNRSFRRRWKKTWKLRVTGLCVGNSPVTGEFPAQMASNAENVSIWWRHHGTAQIQNDTKSLNTDLAPLRLFQVLHLMRY